MRPIPEKRAAKGNSELCSKEEKGGGVRRELRRRITMRFNPTQRGRHVLCFRKGRAGTQVLASFQATSTWPQLRGLIERYTDGIKDRCGTITIKSGQNGEQWHEGTCRIRIRR